MYFKYIYYIGIYDVYHIIIHAYIIPYIHKISYHSKTTYPKNYTLSSNLKWTFSLHHDVISTSILPAAILTS